MRFFQDREGSSFRAHDPVLDRNVALKVIRAADEERRQRFRREAQSAARLTHPNIGVVHDFGEDSGRFFMAMELLDGADLKRAIKENAFADIRTKLQIMEQVCDAVAHAHSQNDFGLARVGHSDVTTTGTILGSPNYMSPEQIRGTRIDARADIFSLGSVFYELLSGRKAFQAESLPALFYKVMHHEPEPLRMAVPSIPVAISDMVKRALAKEPALHFQSLGEMRDVIRAVRDRGTTAPNAGLDEVMREYQSDTLVTSEEPKRPPVRSTVSTSVSAESGPVRVVFASEPGGGNARCEVHERDSRRAAHVAADGADERVPQRALRDDVHVRGGTCTTAA